MKAVHPCDWQQALQKERRQRREDRNVSEPAYSYCTCMTNQLNNKLIVS